MTRRRLCEISDNDSNFAETYPLLRREEVSDEGLGHGEETGGAEADDHAGEADGGEGLGEAGEHRAERPCTRARGAAGETGAWGPGVWGAQMQSAQAMTSRRLEWSAKRPIGSTDSVATQYDALATAPTCVSERPRSIFMGSSATLSRARSIHSQVKTRLTMNSTHLHGAPRPSRGCPSLALLGGWGRG